MAILEEGAGDVDDGDYDEHYLDVIDCCRNDVNLSTDDQKRANVKTGSHKKNANSDKGVRSWVHRNNIGY